MSFPFESIFSQSTDTPVNAMERDIQNQFTAQVRNYYYFIGLTFVTLGEKSPKSHPGNAHLTSVQMGEPRGKDFKRLFGPN